MKQKDFALIILIAFVSAFMSFLVSNKVFVTPKTRQQKVEVVDNISASFEKPDSKYFNETSIDPAQNSQIGINDNQNPFNGTSQ